MKNDNFAEFLMKMAALYRGMVVLPWAYQPEEAKAFWRAIALAITKTA